MARNLDRQAELPALHAWKAANLPRAARGRRYVFEPERAPHRNDGMSKDPRYEFRKDLCD